MSFVHPVFAHSPLLNVMRFRTRNYGRVLMYHRIVRDDCDDAERALLVAAITRSVFERQLDYVDRYYRVVPLADLLGQRHAPGGLVALTFDDGYADILWNALPALIARDMRATVFVSTEYLDSAAGTWEERLARKIVAKGPKKLSLCDGGEQFEFNGRYGEQFRMVRNWLAGLPAHRRESLMVDMPTHPHDRFLTTPELRQWLAAGMSVGAHTNDHRRLATLGRAEQRRNLDKATLERMSGRTVDYVAYPFGQPSDFDAVSIEEACRAGYKAAFAGFSGLLDEHTPMYAIPRIRARQDFNRFRLNLARSYTT